MNFPDANILEVDLSRGNIKKTILEGRLHRLYPGGSALGTYILLKELRPKTDPLLQTMYWYSLYLPLQAFPLQGLTGLPLPPKAH